jgi:glycosyltransferase involved in cell wall biosynthesis
MKIIFNAMDCGLGNNGGSLTIVKCANTLTELGHIVTIIDTVKNQHTWNKLQAKHIIVKNHDQIPDADIIIATGYKTVDSTLRVPKRCGLKLHYIRGWETWQMSEDKIVSNVLKVPTLKLVNSICLQNKLKQYGISSTIIRPGYDFDEIYPLEKEESKKLILGGLYTEGKHVPIKRPDWIFTAAEYLKKKDKNVELWMFGAPKSTRNSLIDFYISNPTVSEKNVFYNNVHIWLAPASQEGLHMPPAEAMMTECPVISTEAEMSGTQDYMEHGYTGYVAKNNLGSFIDYTEKLYNGSEDRKNMGTYARKKILQLGSRKENMQNFVNFISGII